MKSNLITYYTDGACKGNPGPGGWAWIRVSNDTAAGFGAGSCPCTTNNRMELEAVRHALLAHCRIADCNRQPVRIVTDSQLVVKVCMHEWTAHRNRDLFDKISALQAQIGQGQVDFVWVKGHSGDAWNEQADQLASAQAELARQEI